MFTSNFSLTPLLTAFITSAVFVFFACRMATAWGLLDRPDSRKQHDGAVPLIGGLSIFIGSWAGLFAVFGWQKALWSPLLATFVIAWIGLLDDRRPLPVLPRVLVQIAAMAVMVLGADLWLAQLGDVFAIGPIVLPMWVGVPLTIVAVIGVINAVNMVDGIDGLAGSLTFMALATMGVMAWGAGRMLEAWVALLFATGIVPYLLCNLGVCGKKRRVFLGDAGSMLLGFVIAWLAIALSQPSSVSQTPVFAPVTALWLFAIPLVDTVSIMLRRLLKGQSPFFPDRDHLHHIVLRMGFRDRHALLFIVLASVVLGGLGLWMEFAQVPEWKRFAAFMAFSALYFVILLKIWRVLKALRGGAQVFRRAVWALFSPLIDLSPGMKRAVLLFMDGALIYAALAVALMMRFGDWNAASRFFEGPLGLLLLAAPLLAFPLFAWFGLYRAVVRFFGSQALWAVVGAVSLYALFYAGGWLLLRSSGAIAGLSVLPMSVIAMHAVLLVLGVGGSRMLGRRLLRRADGSELRGMRVVICGAGDAARQLASVLQQSSGNALLGFVDDRAEMFDRLLQGKPVIAPAALEKFVEQHGVTDVLLADERLDAEDARAQRNALLRQLSHLHVRVRRLPMFETLARGRVQWRDFQDLDVADLLQRDPVVLDSHMLRAQLSRKTVLVLGAGGTIGSALCKQVLDFQPKLLLLYEVNELALHTVYQELLWQLQRLEKQRTAAKLNDSGLRLMPRILPVLGSVQDGMRMQELMHTWKPDVVYHAAAYKHVPMVEHNPAEGLKNNVFGTLIAARAAMEAGVPNFVLISTDKAVRPTNIMGASKRFAEMSLQALASSSKVVFECLNENPIEIENRTHFSMVRFGNVLDSSGSVIPKFRKQIRDGGPITLTHPEITRYFMTIPEAAQLVIQAGAMAKGGDVFVLDMGESVKIADLARRMVELSGLSVRDEAKPDGDIEIVITGLRPGEKLYEELMLGDDPQPTLHPKIQRAQDPFIPWHELENDLCTLKVLLSHNNVEVIIALLQKLVAGYQPSSDVVDWVFAEQMQLGNGGELEG